MNDTPRRIWPVNLPSSVNPKITEAVSRHGLVVCQLAPNEIVWGHKVTFIDNAMGGFMHRIECSCGWRSNNRFFKRHALNELDAHIKRIGSICPSGL